MATNPAPIPQNPGLNPNKPLSQPPQATAPAAPPPVSAPGYTPGMVRSTGYTATPYKVEPQGLVQNQLKGIIADDSPLMQQAATIARQQANARGLTNSSMAVGAGQQAVIAAATPIAQQDASSINEAMTNTANQQNAASQFNATASNNAALANQAATNDALKAQQAGSVQLTNTQMTNNAQIALANLDSKTKMALETMDNRTRSLLQTNQSASQAYVQTIQNVNAIQNNNQMTGDAKQKAIDNELALLQQQLQVLASADDTTRATLTYPQELTDLGIGNYFNPTYSTNATSGSPTPANATPAQTPPAGTPAAPPGATPQNPQGVAFRGPQGQMMVPQGSAPPYPGAIKRGETTQNGGRQIFDVYY